MGLLPILTSQVGSNRCHCFVVDLRHHYPRSSPYDSQAWFLLLEMLGYASKIFSMTTKVPLLHTVNDSRCCPTNFLINDLTPILDTIGSIINNTFPLPSFDIARSMLLREESCYAHAEPTDSVTSLLAIPPSPTPPLLATTTNGEWQSQSLE
ncbi:hypothetical protein OSB04_006418 [Centaurea solstitialis]|uniref:Uncharacterized protein n=1 Tax=Centaurea solstitialis TaxID=347529 RepID=A0AA38TQG8_9ASTR|nr:hypothetical protein OSB04_006418 [Centaurea solstitialis]